VSAQRTEADSQQHHDRLVSGLLTALGQGPGSEAPQYIETHISSVLLSGEYVYKIKKPVNFGFLNFTSLEQRRHFCEEELRLNSRLAPGLYLDVLPITGTVDAPVLGGAGEPVEFALRMRRFPQEALMSRLAAAGRLPLDTMGAVAEQVADFHERAARAAPDSEFSSPEAAFFPVAENFEQIRPLVSDPDSAAQLARLEQWSRQQFALLREQLEQRGAAGWVRECHGDMHLGNMALIDGEVLIFDGIEFNERMRWTDVLGDVGFLAMDLEDRGLKTHANRFLNAYFEHTGDYAALPLLNFYRAYRAMVRAKVAALRLAQHLSASEHDQVLEEYHGYTNLAERYTRASRPALCITHGLSGSGKSTLAGDIVDRYGMLRIRSDVERKRLHGLAAAASSCSTIDDGIYSSDATRATYRRLVELAETALRAGYPVVVDAAFLKRWQRDLFSELAAGLEIPFAVLDIDVPLAQLRSRIAQRQAQGTDASEADLNVLEQQMLTREPLAGAELAARRTLREQNMEEAIAPLID
jgi:aminoglycoside phosphotransferase family enzyme/gluconate kinase